MADPVQSWRHLRASRADPPDLARDRARRRVYAAALEQAEELWAAAGHAGPSVSPILLFYALAQGCQAVLAARERTNNGWRAGPAHGLSLEPMSGDETKPLCLAAISARDNGTGLFQQLAGLVESATLPLGATLEELVCAIPEVDDFITFDANARTPLNVAGDPGFFMGEYLRQGLVVAWVDPFPENLIPPSTVVNPSSPEELPTVEVLSTWLRPYPSATGDLSPSRAVRLRKPSRALEVDTPQIALAWEHPTEDLTTFKDRAALLKRVIDYPTGGLWSDDPSGSIIPAVGGNARPQQPIVSWFAILYSLSMLARYHPNRWMRMLDLDKSTEAELLRTLLAQGHASLPWLILVESIDASEQTAP